MGKLAKSISRHSGTYFKNPSTLSSKKRFFNSFVNGQARLPLALQQPEASLFSNEIINACSQARATHPNDEHLRIDFKGLSRIKVSLVLARYHHLTTLHEQLSSSSTIRSSSSSYHQHQQQRWNIPCYDDVKPVREWTSLWDINQDSDLLIGIWTHGFGNWTTIQRDHRLGLTLKTLRNPQVRSWDEYENQILLSQRADYLLDHLHNSVVVLRQRRRQQQQQGGGTSGRSTNRSGGTYTIRLYSLSFLGGRGRKKFVGF